MFVRQQHDVKEMEKRMLLRIQVDDGIVLRIVRASGVSFACRRAQGGKQNVLTQK